MSIKNIVLAAIVGPIALAITPVRAESPAAAMVSHPCAGCHGTLGQSQGQAPLIAGLPATYIRSAMLAYKSGERASTIMGRLARGYSDEEINAMADFFAAQPWKPAAQTVDTGLAAHGGELQASRFCSACHGPTGVSPSPTTPNLNGQYADYLYFQMQDIQNPAVGISAGASVMRAMFTGLSEEDKMALAAFYASQK